MEGIRTTNERTKKLEVSPLPDGGDDKPTSGGVIHYDTLDVLPGLEPHSPTSDIKTYEDMKALVNVNSTTPLTPEAVKEAEDIMAEPETEHDKELAADMSDVFNAYKDTASKIVVTDKDFEDTKESLVKAQSSIQTTLIAFLKKATSLEDFKARTKATIRFIATSGKDFLVSSAKPLTFYAAAAVGVQLTTIPLPFLPNGLIDWNDPFQGEDLDTWVERSIGLHVTKGLDQFNAQDLAVWVGGVLGHIGYQIVQSVYNKSENTLIQSLGQIGYTAVWPYLAMRPAQWAGRVLTLAAGLQVSAPALEPDAEDIVVDGLQSIAINNATHGDPEFANALVLSEDPASTAIQHIKNLFPDAAKFSNALISQETRAMVSTALEISHQSKAMLHFAKEAMLGNRATPASTLALINRGARWLVGGNPNLGEGGLIAVPQEMHAMADEVNAAMGMTVYILETSKATFNAAIKALTPSGMSQLGMILSGTTTTAAGLLTGRVNVASAGAGVVFGGLGGFIDFIVDFIRARR